MPERKLVWRERQIAVKRGKGGTRGYLECDGFKATPRELEVLSLKAMGLKHREIADKLSIKHQVSKNCLHTLKLRNAREVGGKQVWPSTMELIQRAEELELLNPYAIKGLESILEKI